MDLIPKPTIEQGAMFVSIRKLILGLIPLGQIVDEAFFEFSSRVKQERINRFSELFINYFKHKEINLEELQTEEFVDLFDSVIRKVSRTSVEEKLKRYRNILINQIENPNTSNDANEIYLDLVEQLSEVEITILKFHDKYGLERLEATKDLQALENLLKNNKEKLQQLKQLGQFQSFEYNDLENATLVLEARVSSQKTMMSNIVDYRDMKNYDLDSSAFLYYKQKLFSKGLLVDNGIGVITYGGNVPFTTMEITEFGKQFIHFIIDSE